MAPVFLSSTDLFSAFSSALQALSYEASTILESVIKPSILLKLRGLFGYHMLVQPLLFSAFLV